MKTFKIFTITLFIIFSSLTNITYAETLNFPAGIYEGEIDKKGRANGEGVFKFNDGSVYEGTFSKNRFNKKGKFLDPQGNVIFEGKHKWGRYTFYPEKRQNKKYCAYKIYHGYKI